MHNTPFYTASDAARLLAMSAAGVRAAAQRGDLVVAERTCGGQRLFRLADLQDFGRQRGARQTARAAGSDRAAARIAAAENGLRQ